jgi:hypothetical protein
MKNFIDPFRGYFDLDIVNTVMFTVTTNFAPAGCDHLEYARTKYSSSKPEAAKIYRA